MKTQKIPLILISLIIASCASVSQDRILDAQSKEFSGPGLPSYVVESLKDFSVLKLENGIPLIIKKNTSSRVLSLQIFLEGNTVILPEDKPGIEGLTLAMISKGGSRYNYQSLQNLFYTTTSGFSASAGSFDFGSYGMTALDSYLPQILDAFTNTFLEPAWDPKEFESVIQEARMALAMKKRDPLQQGVEALHKITFGNHPYSRMEVTEESLKTITLQDLKDYYKRTFVSSRMFLVAVGNFDSQDLVSMLNKSIGKMPPLGLSLPPVPDLPYLPQVLKFPQNGSQGVAYLRGDFPLPGPGHPDYPAISLAFSILGDILYDVVRTQHGAAYGIWARTHPFKAPYGSLTVFKTQKPGEVKPWIDEAIGILASGRCLAGTASASAAGKSGMGSETESAGATYVKLDQALEFYKARYINSFYEGQQENSSIGTQIALSVLYEKDYRDYLGLMGRISKVTADDVVRVIGQYLNKKSFSWVVVGTSEMLKTVDEKKF